MKVVHKFELQSGFSNGVQLPIGATVVHFGSQEDTHYIWVELDPAVTVMEMRVFALFGTGFTICDNMIYIGTTQVPPYVWHCYEEPVA